MIFPSLAFFTFFIVVFTTHWAIIRSESKRLSWLLIASYFFYMTWNAKLVSLVLLSTLIDYFLARGIASSEDPRRRKLLLTGSIVSNLGILAVFKYTNFFLDSAGAGAALFGWNLSLPMLHIALPIGISFYTFQSMSYTLDVYSGRIKPSKSLRDFALFISFFPQLIAGPIVRARQFMPQLEKPRRFLAENFVLGFDLFLMGLIKKVFVADRLSVYVDIVYKDPLFYDGLTSWLATIAYAFQIYCDFSGYSDMARGLGRVFGFDIPVNFKTPYLSKNISEFWTRWHITLSQWLRDYLFTGMGGYRCSRLLSLRNLFLTMFLGGLWHGASWTFAAWGIFHGGLLVLRRFFNQLLGSIDSGIRSPLWDSAKGVLSRGLVFALVCVGWVLFRSQTFAGAWHMLGKMFGAIGGGHRLISEYSLLLIAGMFVYDLAAYSVEKSKTDVTTWLQSCPPLGKAFCYAAVILLLLVFAPHETDPFIYFQF